MASMPVIIRMRNVAPRMTVETPWHRRYVRRFLRTHDASGNAPGNASGDEVAEPGQKGVFDSFRDRRLDLP